MIPRYQTVLLYGLFAGIVLMAGFLSYERERMHERFTAQDDATPLAAPVTTGTEAFTLELANDGDGSVTATQRQIALPEEPSVRARALIERLMAEYALPASTHPLATGAAVDDVFLLNLPIVSPATNQSDVSDASNATGNLPPSGSGLTQAETGSGSAEAPGPEGQLAVINLRSTFVSDHPSGVQVEMLTIESILGTLHANFSQITQVRFLVDGQPRETLAGHADLSRVYPAVDTTVSATQLQPTGEANGSAQ